MPRLGHKKSRLGCRQCKARHVKCDELKPCTNCARHGVPCSLVVWDPNTYQPTASASSAASSSRHTNQSPPERFIADSSASSTHAAHTGYSRNPSIGAGTSAVSTISEEDSSDSQSDAYPFLSRYIHVSQPSQSSLWLRDLELLHHWTTEAFDGLSQRPDLRNMWRVEAPKHANAHDYLMHEILAFAALHKAYQQPPDQRQPYYACGIHHQDLAIRGVRERLHNVTNDQAPAIVATSTLLTLSVFASAGFEAQTAPTSAAVDSIDSIMNAFHLMQGQSSGPLTNTSSFPQPPIVMPLQSPAPMGYLTTHGETQQPFSLQLQDSKYAVQMGSAVDEPVPDED
ncbi:hypothetical protein ACET3X_004542 [Alternaria dauci]|uniref:Zn(2)-C6 fungal-type domain-containing protein n=1 Tax=Alternaria dauci TaxID=48095 RepID=A0ABR3UN82_9PLEO